MGQRNCPKHVQFYSKNKSEKLMHLVGFTLRCYFFAKYVREGSDLVSGGRYRIFVRFTNSRRIIGCCMKDPTNKCEGRKGYFELTLLLKRSY